MLIYPNGLRLAGKLVRKPKLLFLPSNLYTCLLTIEVRRNMSGESETDIMEVWVDDNRLAYECHKNLKAGQYVSVEGILTVPNSHDENLRDFLDDILRIEAFTVRLEEARLFQNIPQSMPCEDKKVVVI